MQVLISVNFLQLLVGPTTKDQTKNTVLNPPIEAQYFRINPQYWSYSLMCLRTELYGCSGEQGNWLSCVEENYWSILTYNCKFLLLLLFYTFGSQHNRRPRPLSYKQAACVSSLREGTVNLLMEPFLC